MPRAGHGGTVSLAKCISTTVHAHVLPVLSHHRQQNMTSTIARPSTLATLPTEVLESIILFLSQHDLTRCVCVSRAWNEALNLHLWRTIPLLDKTRLMRFMSPNTQQALYKNAAHVRELQVRHEKLYNLFPPSRQQTNLIHSDAELISSVDAFTIGPLTNLRVLVLHRQSLVRKYVFDEGIFEIVRQNPGLRRLKIDIVMEPKVLFRLVTEHVPNLQELDIESPWRGDVKALLDNLPEGLRTVRLIHVYHQVPREGITPTIDPSAPSATMKRPLQHHSLEKFHIDGNLDGHEEQVLVPFLESCSQNLKSISGLKLAFPLLSFQNARISNVLSNMGVVWTRLRRDDFSDSESTDSNIAQVISIGPNWTHIELFNRWVGPLTTAAILDNCERLEVLDIMGSGTGELTGYHLQMILSKAPRLRSLQAHGVVGAQKISSVDILSSEWATTSLEHVDFKIHVPRVAADREDADDDGSSALRAFSRDIQRQVLRRFGQQTQLRKLVIGGGAFSFATDEFGEFDEFGRQIECLEMTLDSGLDELEGLKQLEHMDIYHMDHRVGVPELEWMAFNLPKLKRLRGMHDNLRQEKEGVRKWLSSHQPTWNGE
ncbi:MAG: hypothetical protein J3R72DRAFT_241654 [Linnemannia gamsii]|nr:MAG: hypothetical protein J3R72DRAFT_241654 [Linnemannia gamsii]